MSKASSGLKRGAEVLLSNYHHSQSDIAEAYVKGDIPEHLERFVLDVISDHHIADARDRLDRTSWRLEERVAKLEEEMTKLEEKVCKLQAGGLQPPSKRDQNDSQRAS